MDTSTRHMAAQFRNQAIVFEVHCSNGDRQAAQDVLMDLETRLFELKNRLRKDTDSSP